jgi:hypothetical protein
VFSENPAADWIVAIIWIVLLAASVLWLLPPCEGGKVATATEAVGSVELAALVQSTSTLVYPADVYVCVVV